MCAKLKVRAPKKSAAMMDLILAKLKATQPKDKDCTYEFARSTKQILSKVKYVLRSGIEPLDHAMGGFAFGR